MEKHTHQADRIGIARITKDINPDYPGTSGDKSFLMHVCKCGYMEAFEYGSTSSMRKLMKEIQNDNSNQ